MTGETATILVVDDDPAIRASYTAILERNPGFRVEAAPDGERALRLARELEPDCIVSDLTMPGVDGFELARQVKADPRLATTMVIIISGIRDLQTKIEGFELGVDDYLTKPVDALELLARVRAALRTRRLLTQLQADKEELEVLAHAVGQSFDQLLSLMVYMADLRLPGAAERGRRLAETALRIAERFEVPSELLRDLELAALLHEIGRALDPNAGPQWRRWLTQDDWRSLVVAKQALDRIERLKPAGELIGAIMENWDGSGFPEKLQRGQIPLRSRLLRTLIDFFAAVEPPRGGPALTLEAAFERLEMHAGTWYDPLVVGQLESVVKGEPDLMKGRGKRRVPVEELEVGMVLAEDLVTSSGVKLLSAGATINARSLEMIRRRDVGDPLANGAWVYPAEGGA
jgi:response regulator RpfG family c-di-GMP phosphodiesterase